MELDKINIENLVDYLTKEVMKNMNLDRDKKDEILVINSKEDEKEINADNFKVVYFNELEELNVESFKHIIISSFTLNQLTNITIGKSDDNITSIIIECILKGKNIFILNDGVKYRKYKNTANINFYNMIETYEKNIISFGINFIDEDDIDNLIKDNKKNIEKEYDIGNKKSYEIDNKIITESVLEKIYRQGHINITIKSDAIITPLAKDYIRINNIKIFKK